MLAYFCSLINRKKMDFQFSLIQNSNLKLEIIGHETDSELSLLFWILWKIVYQIRKNDNYLKSQTNKF